MRTLICAAAAAWAAASTPLHAQDEAFAAALQAINAEVRLPDRRTIETSALATLQAIAKAQRGCVPSGVDMQKATPATADRIALQAIQAGHIRNMWLAYGTAIGCPAVTTRFMLLKLPNDEVMVREVNPGESLAPPAVMRDASSGAAAAALTIVRTADGACDGRDMDMIGTRVTLRSADLSEDFYGTRYRGNWSEVWTFRTCGRRVDVPVAFATDGNGGAAFDVKADTVVLLDR